MNKALPVVLLILTVALSGCTGSKSQNENAPLQMQSQMLEHPNLNLDGKIVDVKFFPPDPRAGEKVSADLIVANTGTEIIKNETIEIKAKVITLQDSTANIGLKFMKDEDKTRDFTMDFDTEIKPGTNEPIGAYFNTPKEMKGYSLAGTYEITIILSLNEQKVESTVLPLKLRSGIPREFTPTPTPPPTPTPTPTLAMMVTQIPTPTFTPTPIPTPEPVVVATPTGKMAYVRINNYYLSEPVLKIDPGDAVEWYNVDDDDYTLVENDNKIINISIKSGKRTRHIFNQTGDYHFGVTYSRLRTTPKQQEIIVRVNASH